MHKSVTEKYSSASLVLKEKEEQGALLVGDCTSPADKHILKPHRILTIITVGQDSEPEKKEEGVQYILHNVLDNKSQKIGELLDKVYEEIEAGRGRGGVLVHCFTGISRSPSFVIAYLMRKRALSYDDARAFLKKQRSVAHPNDNFHRQLQSYDKLLARLREEERLRRAKEEEEGKEKEPVLMSSAENYSSVSGLSKKTLRGVKGAVKSAFREESLEKKSIEETEEKKESPTPEMAPQHGSRQEGEDKRKQVETVYGNKTKIF